VLQQHFPAGKGISLGIGRVVAKGLQPNKSRLHEVLKSLASIATDADERALEWKQCQQGKKLEQEMASILDTRLLKAMWQWSWIVIIK
jgi:hypothetical protein